MKIQTKLKYHYLKSCLFSTLFPNRSRYEKTVNKRVWIFLSADYGNLGDVAITQFQEEFLKKNFLDYEIVTVPISKTIEAVPQVKKAINADDIVTIVGGGNISDLYEDIEFLRQLVIRSFPSNRIISFPQSIYLTESPVGNKEKRRIAKIYGAHRNLLILMRDKVSYERMRQIIPSAQIKLAPDIVMSADCRSKIQRKKQVLVCLRNDKESTEKDADKIMSIIRDYQEKGYDIIRRDTQIDDQLVGTEGGKHYVETFLKEVRTSSVMITNRLHGMIFAFITGTPAIISDNLTGKVSATFEWIKDCGYIHFLNSYEGKCLDAIDIKDNYDAVSSHINQVLKDAINH